MNRTAARVIIQSMRALIAWIMLLTAPLAFGAEAVPAGAVSFPPALDSYADSASPLLIKLAGRVRAEPLNLAATVIFLLAILHTFLAPKILSLAHHWRHEHELEISRNGRRAVDKPQEDAVDDVSFKAEAAHFLGEIEAVFGLWVIPLLVVVSLVKGWPAAESYVSHGVHFTEPIFVVVIMALAASRPVLRAAEQLMHGLAGLFGGTPGASWFVILSVGPLLGSFITEPAAMTICALLLADSFYARKPSPSFAYATLGLLFVNVSIGGTLTHFAAPPVLMVAGKWGWGMGHMLGDFGWKAALAVVLGNTLYYLVFRRHFAALQAVETSADSMPDWSRRKDPVPGWITAVHLAFLAWTVFTAHHAAFFVGGFLFFLAFAAATEHHQNPVQLRSPLLVGFFLAGLVVHGGLQSWWIAPVLESMGETSLFFGSVVLTAFNDNAAITYLASLVPDLSPAMKHAVVAGAVTGGGLTVIANAPNPAGQAVLGRFFPDGLSPVSLFLAALPPTIIASACFLLFK